MSRIYKALASLVVLWALFLPATQHVLPRVAWLIFLITTLATLAAAVGLNLPEGNRAGTRGIGFVVFMTLAGLAAGVITVALCDGPYYSELSTTYGQIKLGLTFGAIVVLCFAITGVTRNILRLVCFFAAVACTLPITVLLAMGLRLGAALLGNLELAQIVALFGAGMTGGFIVLSAALILCQSKMRIKAIARNALPWAALAGALSPVGWALGPSLGSWIWLSFHALGLTAPTDTLQNALYGETGYGPPSRLFALFVIWQTGMGFALGMALRTVREEGETSSLDDVKLT
jgi:hypothetical protein